jgi:hypothetical protein
MKKSSPQHQINLSGVGNDNLCQHVDTVDY